MASKSVATPTVLRFPTERCRLPQPPRWVPPTPGQITAFAQRLADHVRSPDPDPGVADLAGRLHALAGSTIEPAADDLTPLQQRMVDMILQAIDNPGQAGSPHLERIGAIGRKAIAEKGDGRKV